MARRKKGKNQKTYSKNSWSLDFSQYIDSSSFVGKGNHSVVGADDNLPTPLGRRLVFPCDLRENHPPKHMLRLLAQFSVSN